MKRTESKFLKWFLAQFGPRESGTLTDAELVASVKDGKNSERILRERANWDANYRAALYAWQASIDGVKPKRRRK